MLSLPQRLTASGRFSGPNSPNLGRFLSSKPARVTCAVVVALGLLLLSGSLYAGHGDRSAAAAAAANTVIDALQEGKTALSSSAQKGRFHLLIPATSSNQDLCKLMLSAQILGYPTPVFINFGHPEAEDAYIQHLAKVEGILDYLDRLENDPEYKEELVLIVDGYDLWFQLRPEVLLKRYYALNEQANKRLKVTYGDTVARAHDMRQTILFGPDKICWPINFARTACWAVSGTTLRDDAFGPGTSNGRPELAYPRWLNSGTIMGPASDLKTMFRRTLEMIHENHIVDSDQYYLAEVYGKQEYARLLQNKGELDRYTSVRYGYMEANASKPEEANIPTWIEPDMPEIGEDETVEYHIGIDFESGLFQTLAFWKQYLTWMRPSESWVPGRDLQPPAGSQSYYQLWLPGDISSSLQPFATVSADQASSAGAAGLDIARTWHDVDLLYNPITKQVPVIIHFTGEKQFRDIWWKKIWFQEHAAVLRESALNHQFLRQQEPMMDVIGGYRWFNAEPPEVEDVKMRGLGGAWSDDGGWFSWRSLCHAFEEDIYRVPNDDDYHAPPMEEEEQET